LPQALSGIAASDKAGFFAQRRFLRVFKVIFPNMRPFRRFSYRTDFATPLTA
jgi:hypothetical protein